MERLVQKAKERTVKKLPFLYCCLQCFLIYKPGEVYENSNRQIFLNGAVYFFPHLKYDASKNITFKHSFSLKEISLMFLSY